MDAVKPMLSPEMVAKFMCKKEPTFEAICKYHKQEDNFAEKLLFLTFCGL